MSEDLDTSNNDDQQQSDDSSVIRDLRQKANRTDTAEAEAETAKRELTLHKAGLGTLSDKQQKALTAAHEGDWEPEGLKATALELGFAQQPGEPQNTEPKIPSAELDAHRRVADAAGGSPPLPEPELTTAIAEASSSAEIRKILSNAGKLAEGD